MQNCKNNSRGGSHPPDDGRNDDRPYNPVGADRIRQFSRGGSNTPMNHDIIIDNGNLRTTKLPVDIKQPRIHNS